MLRVVHTFTCLFLLVGLLVACSVPQPVVPAGPEEFNPRILTRIAAGGVFAVDPQAEKVALDRDGLYLFSMDQGTEQMLIADKPLALAWSADGKQLAATSAKGESSRLVVYGADGQEHLSSKVAGRVTQLVWTPDNKLLALSIRLHAFTFGVNQKAELLRWDLQRQIESFPLFETTLKSQTVKGMGEELYHYFRFDLTPLGDEIVYTRLYDPPVISKSIKVIHRHLKTNSEQLVYDLPLESGGSFWSSDSESIWMSNGSSRTFLYDMWQEKTGMDWPLPGQHLAVSRTAMMQYVDGHLYQGGQELAQLQDGRATFSLNGRVLLVADEQQLFAYTLPAAVFVQPVASDKLERLLQLREFRSKNLLSIEEYLQTRERILQ